MAMEYNTTKELYQFVVSDYSATGEGRTVMLLITRAYPHTDDYATQNYLDNDGKFCVGELHIDCTVARRAHREFSQRFGGYYANGAENLTREYFLAHYGHYLPEFVKTMLDSADQPGNLFFAQEFHFNFS